MKQRNLFLASAASVFAALLTGCGMGSSGIVQTPVTIPAVAGAQGVFMGGQQPVGGVTLQLYQTGTSGYGSAATPLFTPGAIKTTAAGNFTFPSFSCSSGTNLYLVGTGGQPIAASGNTPAVTNNNLALMTALGRCDFFNPSSFINVNEITSVAAVYTLSPFMTGITNVGTSSTNGTGLNNAFASFNKIANTTNGQLATPGGAAPTTLPANATLPSALINTLADIMEQCINSGGGSASDTTDGHTNGTACGKLFYLTPNSAGTYPTDTITAMLNLAQHPTVNTTYLNQLRSASPVFTPALSVNTPPAAFSIGISYTGGGLNKPYALAVDSAGNVWTANQGGNSVSEFTNTGLPISSSSGYTVAGLNSPQGIAIDLNDNAWVTSYGSNLIGKIPAGGASSSVFTGNGLASPRGIAVDSNNQIWVTNSGSQAVSAFTNSGAAVSGSPFTGGGVYQAVSVAVSPR